MGRTTEMSGQGRWLEGVRGSNAVISLLVAIGREQLRRVAGVGPLLDVYDRLDEEAWRREMRGLLQDNLTVHAEYFRDWDQMRRVLDTLTDPALHRALTEFARDREGRELSAQLAEAQLDLALAAFRTRVLHDVEEVDYRGISGHDGEREVTGTPLADVYIDPRFEPESADPAAIDEQALLLQTLADEDTDASARRDAERELRWLMSRRRRSTNGRISLEQVLQHQHVVVQGGPGSGKTSLTRYLAGKSIREGARTPMRVQLATFASERRTEANLSLRTSLDRFATRMGGNVLHQALERERAAGRLWFLLDGMDEEPDHTRRLGIARAVDELVDDFPQCGVLVTSRPFGYVRLRGDFPHYFLASLDPEQRRTFVHAWHAARERRRVGLPDIGEARLRADRDLEALGTNRQVDELASNPLILVLLLFLRSARLPLPDRRVELYERVVTFLVEEWNHVRSDVRLEGARVLDDHDLQRVLARVALWAMRNHPHGVLVRRELAARIVHELVDLQIDEDQPERTADAYLDAITRRAGILEEHAPDVFAFWHPSFAEYLAAVEVARDQRDAAVVLSAVRGDPSWQEVIQLVVGHVGRTSHEVAGRVLLEIAEFDRPADEPILHRMLETAAQCLMDRPRVPRSTKEELLRRLAGALATHPRRALAEVFVDVGGEPGLTPREPETVAELSRLTEHNSEQVRLASTFQ